MAVELTVARNATVNIAMIDLKTFSIGCVLSLMISSLVIWLMTFLDPDDIFIIRYGKIHPYFAIIFVVVINLYVGLDTTTKDYQQFKENGFSEIRRDYQKLLAFYPYFSAFVALLCALSQIINNGDAQKGFIALQLLASSVAIVMSVGLAYGCSKGIIKYMEKMQKEYLQDYLDEIKEKD